MTDHAERRVSLPDPALPDVQLSTALAERRSRRSFTDEAVSLEAIASLCWAAQGVTDDEDGFRSAPSAGATYPIELSVVIDEGAVPELSPGIYAFRPDAAALALRTAGSVSSDLRSASHDQAWATGSGVSLAVSAVPQRTEAQYGSRGSDRYVPMEAGHVGQNVYLAAEALGLGTVCVGAFDDEAVGTALDLPDDQVPLAIYPVGHLA
ncbi:MAG: SagB/ThcOx family dehydrogenase [Halanaeroarchaeum sp.]